MIKMLFSSALCMALSSCEHTSSQVQKNESSNQIKVGGPCEGCEAIYESKTPFTALNEVDTLTDFNEAGPKLVISGTVYKSDGKTPAPGVVLYVYHTDQTGRYRVNGTETGWGTRHGSIRGWMKTGAEGRYKFYTLHPASYSKQGPPAHIHITVKEPSKAEYWIDDFHFDDDPFLTAEDKKKFQNRGGNGVLYLEKRGSIYYGERQIYLGKGVTDYPPEKTSVLSDNITTGRLVLK
jgi:protocatechuate 3,4-dioxygenase beta subunit